MKAMTTNRRSRHVLAAATLGALLAGAAASANAADAADAADAERYQLTVKYGDLDLSAMRDARILYSRIHTAAEAVCWRLDPGELLPRMHMQGCVQNAITEAVTRVNRPTLFAVYNAINRAAASSKVVAAQ